MDTKNISARVEAKYQNRMALGMMTAFIKMKPEISIEELNKLFDMKSIAPDCGIDKLFLPPKK